MENSTTFTERLVEYLNEIMDVDPEVIKNTFTKVHLLEDKDDAYLDSRDFFITDN